MLLLFTVVILCCGFMSVSLFMHKSENKHSRNFKSQNTLLRIPGKVWNNPQAVRKVEEYEICYFGRMFDIQHIQYSNDSVFVYGHFDKKETMLLDSIIAGIQWDEGRGVGFIFVYLEPWSNIDIRQNSQFESGAITFLSREPSRLDFPSRPETPPPNDI